MLGVDDRLITPDTMKWVRVGLIAGIAIGIVIGIILTRIARSEHEVPHD